MANFQLAETQQVTLTLQPVDANGNVGALSGTPTWSIDNNVPANITSTATNGLSVVLTGQVAGSTVNITASAQSSNGTSLTATLSVDIIGGPATSMTIVPGTPTNKS
jgi:hypothetical protein